MRQQEAIQTFLKKMWDETNFTKDNGGGCPSCGYGGTDCVDCGVDGGSAFDMDYWSDPENHRASCSVPSIIKMIKNDFKE